MTMDAVHAYRAATENTPNLIAAVRRIETDVLRKMRDEGYGINQLRTALSESRYPLFTEQKDVVNEYLESILPDGASAATNFSLPAPPARFNMLYESPLRQIESVLAAADQNILSGEEMRRIPQADVREAYIGGSLYGILAGDTKARTAFEHRIWRTHRTAVRDAAERETAEMQSAFDGIWASQRKDPSPALAEENAVMTFLRTTGAQEETAVQLLSAVTEYTGRDKEAYVRKTVASAVRELGAYEAIAAADDAPQHDSDVYAACLKDAVHTLGSDTLPYEAERHIVGALRSAGMDEETLSTAILSASPLVRSAGRDPERTLDALLTGKPEEATYVDGDCVTCADIYQRLITAYDDALIDAGVNDSVTADRRRYNVKAVRELLRTYGADEEEVKDILRALGGIKEEERTDDYIDRLLAEAKAEPSAETVAANEDTAVSDGTATPTGREDWGRVPAESANVRRERTEEKEAEPQAERAAHDAEREETHDARRADEPVAPLTDKKSIREAKRRLRDYTFTAERVRTRGDKEADEMYEDCRAEIERDVPLPFNGQMDEQIILHLFSLGYEEREIENAVQHNSPRRRSQKDYAKSIVRGVRERCPSAAKVIKDAETKYLQTKMERGQTLTTYEKERVLVRDVPTG